MELWLGEDTYLAIGRLHLLAVFGVFLPLSFLGVQLVHELHQSHVLRVGNARFEMHGHKSVGDGLGEQCSVCRVFLVTQSREAAGLLYDLRLFDQDSDQVFNMERN